MTTFVPSYYRDFSCIADACRHSCCIGWEIDIDPDTKARYDRLDSPTGERLRRAIRTDGDGGAYMEMTADGRCPFLNGHGLCDIILSEGEEALCQICADHPRFRSFFSDRTEMGLGACCEAAATLILSQREAVTLVPLGDEAPLSPTAEETAFFQTRDRLIAIAQDRTMPVDERLETLLRAVGKTRPPLSRRQLFGIYSSLERLDPSWDTVLNRLLSANEAFPTDEIRLEQWLVYGLFRHTADSLQDGLLSERVAMVVHSVRLIAALCEDGTLEETVSLVRAYSAEAEYSPDNLEQLIDTF